MPAQNPFLDEIDNIVTAIIDLKIEQTNAGQSQALQIAAEIDAKDTSGECAASAVGGLAVKKVRYGLFLNCGC